MKVESSKEEDLYLKEESMLKLNRIKELVEILHKASVAYYQYDKPIMSDKQYDDLYDELGKLERETGVILNGSPTQKVQGFILKGLEKQKHSKPMLSAAKTKDINDIKKFAKGKPIYGSYKLDGLTLVVIFENGEFKTLDIEKIKSDFKNITKTYFQN